jgi:opacity protein-like surface antigen
MWNRIFTILLVFALSGFTHQAQAGAWHLGGGVQWVEFGDDLDLVDEGFGVIFSAAYQQNDIFSLDIQLGSSAHETVIDDDDYDDYDFYDDDDYNFYGYAMIGGKLSFSPGKVQPYVTVGISFHSIDFDEFDTVSGEGAYWGIGADFLITPNHAINASYRESDWDGEDDIFDYDVNNSYLGIAYNYRFSP